MHLKGTRFGLPAIQRISTLADRNVHRIAWNSHANIELHFLLKGSFTWEIKGRKGVYKVTVPGGGFLVIPGGASHRADDEIGPPSMRVGVICQPLTGTTVAGSSLSPDEFRHVYGILSEHAGTRHCMSPSLVRVLKDIWAEMDSFRPDDPESRMNLRILCELLLVRAARDIRSDHPLLDKGDVIPQIRKWIGEHLSETISVRELVERAGYGRSRFFQIFLSEVGMSPNDYITRLRIERAKTLILSQPDLTMVEIGRQCGFKTPIHFTQTFRKHVGMPPRCFREQKGLLTEHR